MARAGVARWFSFVAVGLSSIAAMAAPPQIPLKGRDVRMIEAGAELWATVDYSEVQTFDEGVMEKPEDRIRRSHEPSRQEKWQFGQQFETFAFDGLKFTGTWRSPAFQAQFFTEFVLVEGELAPSGATVRTLRLTKIRFDRPSVEPPEQRGYSKIVLRFENLVRNPGLGNAITYRFVPGTSTIAIEAAVGDYLSSEYHSRTVTTWTGLGASTGTNDVTGRPHEIFASVTFQAWGRQGPPPAAASADGAKAKVVRLSGDSKLEALIIAWLSKRKGVEIVDQTARVAAAVEQERGLAAAGLLEEGTGPSKHAPTIDADAVLELTSIGTDPRDPSTRAILRQGGSETEVLLDLEMERFQKLGDAAFGDWVRLQTDAFLGELAAVLVKGGL